MSSTINDAMTIKLDYELPEYPAFEAGIRRAPRRESHLSEADKALAIKNALRYIHPDHHEQMAKEFAQELEEHGRIYGYRFRPAGKLYGKPIEEYKGNCTEAKAFQVMIDNNLDFDVALYPYELVTYGESGQVCQNWMQYRLIKKYLEVMTDEQTLVVMSGHPLGLFHSHRWDGWRPAGRPPEPGRCSRRPGRSPDDWPNGRPGHGRWWWRPEAGSRAHFP